MVVAYKLSKGYACLSCANVIDGDKEVVFPSEIPAGTKCCNCKVVLQAKMGKTPLEIPPDTDTTKARKGSVKVPGKKTKGNRGRA